MRVHNYFDYRDREVGDVKEFDVSLTKQADAKDADINNIMKRYEKTGLLPQLSRPGQYGDFSEVRTYREALDQVMEAQSMFEALPGSLRARFGNDPELFLEFVDNPANAEELVKLGLVAPKRPVDAPGGPATPNSSSSTAVPAASVPPVGGKEGV